MNRLFKYFDQIIKIPHCSHDTSKLKNFLINFAIERNYSTFVDKSENILVKKGSPLLCLQAHYDMVCVGNTKNIETFIEDGWMRAKNSTLGSDNGVAIAMMMVKMDDGEDIEFLFTSDEEVGLLGASALEFDLESKYMLNLDSEDEAEVYIGCAGGIDIEASRICHLEAVEGKFYTLSISGLKGGHSGVQIHEHIPNAIKLFSDYCIDKDIKIVSIEGGERINSIPTSLNATIFSTDRLIGDNEHIIIKELDNNKGEVLCESEEIISLLHSFSHGVLEYNDLLGIPQKSINLAMISLNKNILSIKSSARAMDNRGLESISSDFLVFFKGYDFDVNLVAKYPAWTPIENSFSLLVNKAMIDVFGESSFKAIHAGLECGVISEKYSDIKIASIGPNIRSPHSLGECVEISSIEKTYDVLERVIKYLKSEYEK